LKLRVLSVFGPATLEDEGRPGFRRFGVPVGGAFDRESFHLANSALGNAPGAPAIEFALGTLELEAEEPGTLAIVGAAEAVKVNGTETACNRRFSVGSGDHVVILPPFRGLRTYIAVAGGIVAPRILGSVSGTQVHKGDLLVSAEDRTVEEQRYESPSSLSPRPLRCVSLVEEDWMSSQYTVSRNINRVGLRLDGPKPAIDARSRRSEPSVFGAVQLTEDRTVIIHGPDGPTIGGYKKIGCVLSQDLDRLAQLAPGDKVTFEKA
jgi:biotin-dependent carboxylase-like uncharacterized protein